MIDTPRVLQVPARLVRPVILAIGCVCLLGSDGIPNSSATSREDIGAGALSTEQNFAGGLQLASMRSDDRSLSDVMAEVSLTKSDTDASVIPNKPEPFVEAISTTAPEAPPPEPVPVQVATVNPSDLEPGDAGKSANSDALNSIEIVDECLVVDICVDRYLWALYQRTPKEDTIKEFERRRVTVKRKGKMVTVTRTFTKLVDEDFGWKDPKAAERAGLSMADYVIGGIDRSFKLKLFHLLHAAEAAGLSPGITSAFRDDYRQSIATGLKAASNRSFHGGSTRGGYGHGLAADIVGTGGTTRNERWASSERLWKWVDAHGKEHGIGRPYLGRDPPHVGPIDGQEYAAHNGGSKQAGSNARKVKSLATRHDRNLATRATTAASSKMKAS
jgi:hypothetical protein